MSGIERFVLQRKIVEFSTYTLYRCRILLRGILASVSTHISAIVSMELMLGLRSTTQKITSQHTISP